MDAVGALQFWGFSPALDLQQVHRTVWGPLLEKSQDDEAATALSTGSTAAYSHEGGQSAGSTVVGDAASSLSADVAAVAAEGPSPGSDLLSVAPAGPSRPCLRMLLVQPGDVRHVLRTVAHRHAHSSDDLQFVLYERSMEVLARALLLLYIATDVSIPLRQRATMWLEVFGNAQVQARTSRYIANARKVLIELLCNGTGPEPLRSLVDFSMLTHRQRDEMEEVMKGWAEDIPFDMVTLRDYRLRHNYGTRYDYRNNLIDWDYQMHLKRHAGTIHFLQYRDWRNTGVGFEFGDQTYNVPNRTLAGYVEGRERGVSTRRRGYWGDTIVSPYHAVGTAAFVPTPAEVRAQAVAAAVESGGAEPSASPASSDASSTTGTTTSFAHQLFEIHSRHSGSEQWRHNAVEIAAYNVLSWLFALETGQQYVMRAPHEVYSGLAEAGSGSPTSSPAVDEADTPATPQDRALRVAVLRARHLARAFAGVKVTLLSGDLETLVSRHKALQHRFDVAFYSGRSVHMLDRGVVATALSAGPCTVLTETARNVPSLTADQQAEFVRRVIGMGTRIGAVVAGSDRQLSADSYSVGSFLDPKRFGEATVEPSQMPAHGTDADGRSMRHFVPSCAWIKPDVDVADAGKGDTKRRAKLASLAAYSHSPTCMPELAKLCSGRSADDATLHASLLVNAEFMRGMASHDIAGGDNPPPEVVVFAAPPIVVRDQLAKRVAV